jgi:hypothetical protein
VGLVGALRIERSATVLSGPLGQPALDYRRNSVGRLGVEPRTSCSQGRRAPICTSARMCVSLASSPCGSRTQPGRLEKPMTSPEVERAVLLHIVFPSARTGCAKWAGRRSNPRLRFFRPPLNRLSYQPKCIRAKALRCVAARREATKKARRRDDAGPWWLFWRVWPSVIGAFWSSWARNPTVRSPAYLGYAAQTASRRALAANSSPRAQCV